MEINADKLSNESRKKLFQSPLPQNLCGNQPEVPFLGDGAAVQGRPGSVARAVRNEPTALSSRRRVEGVEDDATIQHERAVKF